MRNFVLAFAFLFLTATLGAKENPQVTSTTLATKVSHPDCQVFPDKILVHPESQRFTVIDLKSQHLACYENGWLVRICDISAAKKGYDDFVGSWSVLKKSKDAVSSIWKDDEGAPFAMPWAVAIGGGYWIHQGVLPGYPASHGCIRMSRANAKWYFNWSQKGDKGCSYENFKASSKESNS